MTMPIPTLLATRRSTPPLLPMTRRRWLARLCGWPLAVAAPAFGGGGSAGAANAAVTTGMATMAGDSATAGTASRAGAAVSGGTVSAATPVAGVGTAAPSWRPQLARAAPADIDPRGWLVSEKLDGVRVLWDGRRLWLRGGTPLAAPAAFVAGLPAAALDGELWAGRGRFAAIAAAAARAEPREREWAGLRLHAFDLPLAPGTFADRARRLADLAAAQGAAAPWKTVAQAAVADRAALAWWLAAVVADGGEGLVLHRADALHHGGRTGALLKLKPLDDAEAVVVGHERGRGRHADRLGALLVRTPDGVEFRLGTGFSDADRERPPAPGSWVTFTHRGWTAGGVPRFASYLRPRAWR